VSFASDPGWDDGGLPPANTVIPDDARELDRDVLAYHRELRARRRRELLTRILRPSRGRGSDRGGHSPILPLIVTCLALAMLAGAMLSVVTISPASAPTVPSRANATATAAASMPVGLTMLPSGTVRLDGRTEPVRGMTSAVLALVPGGCGCGPALRRLASQAVNARVGLYFVGEGPAIPRLPALTAQDGDGAAVAVSDNKNVLGAVYRPAGLTVLLVYSDATAQVRRDLGSDFQLSPMMHALSLPGKEAAS
jgi:hypothetical protein